MPELERLLFPAQHKSSARDLVPPDLLKVHQELQKSVRVESPAGTSPQALTEPYVRLSPHTALLIHRPSIIQNPNAQTTLAGFPDSA